MLLILTKFNVSVECFLTITLPFINVTIEIIIYGMISAIFCNRWKKKICLTP